MLKEMLRPFVAYLHTSSDSQPETGWAMFKTQSYRSYDEAYAKFAELLTDVKNKNSDLKFLALEVRTFPNVCVRENHPVRETWSGGGLKVLGEYKVVEEVQKTADLIKCVPIAHVIENANDYSVDHPFESRDAAAARYAELEQEIKKPDSKLTLICLEFATFAAGGHTSEKIGRYTRC